MDLWSILVQNSWLVDSRVDVLLACVASILVAGVFLVSLIRRIHPFEIDASSLMALGVMGGISTLIFLSLPVFLAGALLRISLSFKVIFLILTAGLCMGALVLNLSGTGPFTGSVRTLLVLISMLCGLCMIRLTFVHDLSLPPYTDSVEHYLIVNDLLHPERPPDALYKIARLTSRYYHFGYHALAGWVVALSNAPASDVMLILGQILQTIIPVSMFFLVKALTRSDTAGLFSILLAGLGWRMPAFASNWGKYPALTGIVTFLFVLSMLHLAGSAKARNQKLSLLAIAFAAGLVSILTHTRSLVLVIIALGSWWIAGKFLRARTDLKLVILIASVVMTLEVGKLIAQSPELTFMVAPYVRAGFLPTLLVALLLPYGLLNFPRQMVSTLLFLLLLLICTITPLPTTLERFGYQTLLDRPFGQIILFLPLSLIGGIGLAGLGHSLVAYQSRAKSAGWSTRMWFPVSILLCLAVTIHASQQYDFIPSSCCQLVSEDDLAAFDWMKVNLPLDSVILIASNETPSRSYGVDGGIWITPLTGFRTEKWPHNAAMDSPDIFEQLCGKGVTHLYAGGTSSRFPVEVLENLPGWYEDLITRPGAYIYKLSRCTGAAN